MTHDEHAEHAPPPQVAAGDEYAAPNAGAPNDAHHEAVRDRIVLEVERRECGGARHDRDALCRLKSTSRPHEIEERGRGDQGA
jgi:hypothetical protein